MKGLRTEVNFYFKIFDYDTKKSKFTFSCGNATLKGEKVYGKGEFIKEPPLSFFDTYRIGPNGSYFLVDGHFDRSGKMIHFTEPPEVRIFALRSELPLFDKIAISAKIYHLQQKPLNNKPTTLGLGENKGTDISVHPLKFIFLLIKVILWIK